MNVALNAFSAPTWSRAVKRAAVIESPGPPIKEEEGERRDCPRSDVALLPNSEGTLLTRYDNTGSYIVSYTSNYAKVRRRLVVFSERRSRAF